MDILILGLCVILYLAVGIAVVKTRLFRWLQWHLEQRATCFPNDGMSFALIEDNEQDVMRQCRSAREYRASSDPDLKPGLCQVLLWLPLALAVALSIPIKNIDAATAHHLR